MDVISAFHYSGHDNDDGTPHVHVSCPICDWGTYVTHQRVEGGSREHTDFSVKLACGHEVPGMTTDPEKSVTLRRLPPIPTPYKPGQPLRVKNTGQIIFFTREKVLKSGHRVSGEIAGDEGLLLTTEFTNVEPARPTYEELVEFVRMLDVEVRHHNRGGEVDNALIRRHAVAEVYTMAYRARAPQ